MAECFLLTVVFRETSRSTAFTGSNIETVEIKVSMQGWRSVEKILLWSSRTLDNTAHTSED